jgi:hypothetical protein
MTGEGYLAVQLQAIRGTGAKNNNSPRLSLGRALRCQRAVRQTIHKFGGEAIRTICILAREKPASHCSGHLE